MSEWTFTGAASRVQRLKIWLESSGTTTSTTRGTGTTSTQRTSRGVESIEVLDRGQGQPVDFGTVSFTVPSSAMPSSGGRHVVRWMPRLQGEINFWPDVDEQYELQVLPATGLGR